MSNIFNGLQVNQPTCRYFRPEDVGHSQADITKACHLLGYHLLHKISYGLNEAMDWYVSSLGTK